MRAAAAAVAGITTQAAEEVGTAPVCWQSHGDECASVAKRATTTRARALRPLPARLPRALRRARQRE